MLKNSLLLFILIVSNSFFGQKNDSTKLYKPSFGFNFGLNYSALYNSDAIDELQIENGFGFRLGVASSFPISLKWSVDPKMELSFNNGKVTDNQITYQVDPNNLDFVTHFKYKMKGYEGIVKPYCYFGPSLRVPLQGEEGSDIYATRTTLSLDFGFGADIDVKHFIISPEIRFSGGMMDIRENPSGKMLRGSNAAFVLTFSGR